MSSTTNKQPSQGEKDHIKDVLADNIDVVLDDYFNRKEEMKTWYGSCEKDNETDYELLKRHFEVWVSRYPEEMATFLEYKKDTIRANHNEFGANNDGTMRLSMGIPPKLFTLFSVLSPNFIGAKELKPEERKKKLRRFLKEFPIFKLHEKS